ncbi:purine-cytosine permease family protein [Vulcanisaeta distributa]|uniref:Permease for cytosine/purines uracil thiamine allantoin n=1 Tax=Vulcanisaeta distributa (strain DSM 14429 / JCM 11212 / NBRC 100878 / IC-017) TaxID=572478 RepID=E1QTS1_VULDI|nr:cytosine permease [Vulcanisaeta distributa]ADN50988.1 permease for cytosine/purines uracil thiamine allantoin [Vulcanisaeta distributa DSM 14429]
MTSIIERLGIEHIPSSMRHGKTMYQFTLWFASNLTVADYALGPILYMLGLPIPWLVLALVLGNVLGGLLVGLLAAMGPAYGYPQIMISRAAYGRVGNLPFAIANWVSTLGWFSVNAIIGGYIINYVDPAIPLYAAILITVLTQFIIALFGYDVIHRSEYVLSIILGIMFAVSLALALSKPHLLSTYVRTASFNPFNFAIALATVFSYIMSWGPYASDYSRYLPENTSRTKIIAYAALGGLLASLWSEVVGFAVSAATGNTSGLPTVLVQFMGNYGVAYAIIAVIALFLGALAANVLNIYTNSLSALAIYNKARRWQALIAGAVVGTVMAVLGGLNFVGYYEGFLLFLDYWITPWIGILLVMFYVNKTRDWKLVENGPKVIWKALLAYVIGLLISVPFMNLNAATGGLIPFVGPVANALGGADISYFISFIIASIIYLIIT